MMDHGDWQPIESAPKSDPYDDGTILLWGPDMGVGIGWWSEDDGHWVNDCFADHMNECEPTHWMPLPDPPHA